MTLELEFMFLDRIINKPVHVRELARELKLNPMIVARKLSLLMSKNVIDFNKEGRNKTFFLKNSFEAKNWIMMMELYKLNELARKYPDIRRIASSVRDIKNIAFALLFGSYAKQSADERSDIDLFIEPFTKDAKSLKQLKSELEAISSKLSIKIGFYDEDNLLIKEIDKNHVVLKGLEEYYAKRKLFG
ncbi:MAG: nucleotidyltransferase domain-containing protein [Candidatus Parvarchaeota archaeon]|jgi:predicted nucleotidyltransferase|nr:nucleotidyltransferase domain-containing protein [Candidatus Parvarchaeota archaeon]MCL5420200.1 nucleotidyltransferase domain-containing protein [Candidatus Parvarchaeota archaeon]